MKTDNFVIAAKPMLFSVKYFDQTAVKALEVAYKHG